ncbi:MAG: anti-sigma F factor [Defluviitaleaceae bacterium]|nr:anti-sigma F factor [Defluviitaleaceae bacterium]
MTKTKNQMTLTFLATSENQAFARASAAAFATQLNPTMAELTEIKTAVSEAVTNAIIHGYEGLEGDNFVTMRCRLSDGEIYIEIEDSGQGIDDVQQALEPLYTSKPHEERSGMGFTVMSEFMDELLVDSVRDSGTLVKMRKKCASESFVVM